MNFRQTMGWCLVVVAVWYVACFFLVKQSMRSVNAQDVVAPSKTEPGQTKTTMIDDTDRTVVMKSLATTSVNYFFWHSDDAPTVWKISSLDYSANSEDCEKNTVMPAKKEGDYCTASIKIDIKGAICFMPLQGVNTMRCTWPNSYNKLTDKGKKEK
jgi:hypothetical protein